MSWGGELSTEQRHWGQTVSKGGADILILDGGHINAEKEGGKAMPVGVRLGGELEHRWGSHHNRDSVWLVFLRE